jgi:threonine/homoserine/homoserine lactone efflux protein
MFGIHDYGLFLLASFALHAVPGQDVLFVLAQSLANGRRAGVLAALGIGAGSLVHTAAVALGIGALIAGAPAALRVVRLAGASYLVFLALRCLHRAWRGAQAPGATPAVSARAAFGQGFVTNVTNVKVLLFYLAFLPQFVTAGAGGTTVGLLLLGLSFGVTGSLWNSAVALAASAAAPAFARSGRARRVLDAVAGLILLGIAIPIFRPV